MSLRKNKDYRISYKLYKEGFLKKAKMMFVIEEYEWYYHKTEYSYEPFCIYSSIKKDYYDLCLKIKVVSSYLTKELAEEELTNFKLNSYVLDTDFKM